MTFGADYRVAAPADGSILRIIDPDTDKILFDLNDPDGDNNVTVGRVTTKFANFNLGSVEDEASEFAPDSAPGGFVTKLRSRLTTSTWAQRITGPDFDTMIRGANELQRLLRQGGTIAIQLDGSTDLKFLDFEPWKVPSLFRGEQFEGYFRSKLFDDPRGLPIEIRRQPFLRGYEINSVLNLLSNASLLMSTSTPNQPDDWATPSISISSTIVDIGSETFQYQVAASSGQYFAQVIPAAAGDHHTFSMYAYALTLGSGLRFAMKIEYYSGAGGSGSLLGTVGPGLFGGSYNEARYSLSSASTYPAGAPVGTLSAKFSFGTSNTDAAAYVVAFSKMQAEQGDTMSPYREGNEIVPNDVTVAGGRVIPIHIQGSQPVPVNISVKGESGTNFRSVIVGARSNEGVLGRNRLVEFLNTTRYKKCIDGTLGTNASSQSGISGSLSTNVVKVVPADSQLVRRLILPITTGIDSLRGNFTPYLRFSSADAVDYIIQAYWGFSTQDPAPYPLRQYSLSLLNSTATGVWFDLPLGEINVPENLLASLSGIALDIYVLCKTSGKTCYLDVVAPMPSDTLGEMSASSLVHQTWLGSDLIGGSSFTSRAVGSEIDGSVVGTEYLINANHEACALPPVGGLVWPAGHHRVVISGHSPRGSKTSPPLRVLVRNVTDSNNKPDGTNTIDFSFSGANLGAQFSVAVEFDTPGGKALQPQIDWINMNTYISKVEHYFVSAVKQDESLVSDFDTYQVEKFDNASHLVQYGETKGKWPVWCDPGLNMVALIFGDPGPTGSPVDMSVKARAPIVGYRYKPRWYE